ncbi:hypothetical protein SeseC_00665 [Streptococcus equi subsp. zooepidemicus ATCC 35246]|nr:hypothetical protein SeseC_00665 [Streptococcus equi subsp. zooepidemicus ATCC 35246]
MRRAYQLFSLISYSFFLLRKMDKNMDKETKILDKCSTNLISKSNTY